MSSAPVIVAGALDHTIELKGLVMSEKGSRLITTTAVQRGALAKVVKERLEDLDWVPRDDDGPVGTEVRELESLLADLEDPA